MTKQKIKEILEFYAKEENYFGKDHYTSNSDFPSWTWPSNMLKDRGDKAKEALKLLKELK